MSLEGTAFGGRFGQIETHFQSSRERQCRVERETERMHFLKAFFGPSP
jgi:hypothetical protein